MIDKNAIYLFPVLQFEEGAWDPSAWIEYFF